MLKLRAFRNPYEWETVRRPLEGVSLINGIKKDVHTYCLNLYIILDMVFITKLSCTRYHVKLRARFHVLVDWRDLRAKVIGSNSVIYLD